MQHDSQQQPSQQLLAQQAQPQVAEVVQGVATPITEAVAQPGKEPEHLAEGLHAVDQGMQEIDLGNRSDAIGNTANSADRARVCINCGAAAGDFCPKCGTRQI